MRNHIARSTPLGGGAGRLDDFQLRIYSKLTPFRWMFAAGWEIRNLRMIANVRETFRERPGARVLTIVGSSHKPWFDSWLAQLQGVDIVDVIKVLK